METVTINRQVIEDLNDLIEEIQLRLESIELMSDPKFMKSLKKSEEQVKNREFADWNEL